MEVYPWGERGKGRTVATLFGNYGVGLVGHQLSIREVLPPILSVAVQRLYIVRTTIITTTTPARQLALMLTGFLRISSRVYSTPIGKSTVTHIHLDPFQSYLFLCYLMTFECGRSNAFCPPSRCQ